MPHLLHLDSSADAGASRTRSVTRTFAATWSSLGPDHTVTYRDLHALRMPHLGDAAQHWPERLRRPGSVVDPEAARLQAEVLDELLAADVLLLGAPLYNYSMPSTLKAWVDHVHVPGVTAPFDTETQPLRGRAAVVVTSRGAAYEPGSANEALDHCVPVLRVVLGTALGMEVEVIATDLALAEDVPMLAEMIPRGRAELAAAHEAAADAARRLG